MAASSKVLFPPTVLHLLLLFLLLSREGVVSYDVVNSAKHKSINSKLEQAAAGGRRVSSNKIPSSMFEVFNFLPKGTPIPGSGPSARSNLEMGASANKITKKVPAQN